MRHTFSRRQFLKAAGMTTATVCAAGLLSACGSGSSGSSSGAASADTSSYTILYSSQPSTLNYLTTSSDVEMVVGANCVDTLLEFDNKGALKEGLATSWEFDEATLTWTFHLRDENWVEHTEEFEGLVLLAAYSTSDLSGSGLQVLSVYGSEDRVLNMDSYEKYRENLPADFTEVVIPGGCHAYFGCYGAQKGDGTPGITNEEQIRRTAEAIGDLADLKGIAE